MSPFLLKWLLELKRSLQANSFAYGGADVWETFWLDERGHDDESVFAKSNVREFYWSMRPSFTEPARSA